MLKRLVAVVAAATFSFATNVTCRNEMQQDAFRGEDVW
jgi:hypothetical protein